ncbi:SRPBCC family protein [Curvibacter sp. CHRR-16]|uniref:SRPBCC family protein n=1 Tax=Curvibacter sp. CHRR-16 TaxID=2835872 RepID=UPI001BD9BA83|nr:SRPBCC family protein [Curvibacter sp. CHRR-16]MBT0571600.1 SRPBCC family protein [Curvibacter sp. CHRR-16]
MAMTLHMELGYELTVRAPADEVFQVLADVPASASLFPRLHQLEDLGNNRYRWVLERIGIASASLQPVYASTYHADPDKGTVHWTPIAGEGNALVSGTWTVSPKGTGTQLELDLEGDFTLPFPSLMKNVIGPISEAEFEKQIEQYIANLAQRFGGEA